jgi:hypothetical protein
MYSPSTEVRLLNTPLSMGDEHQIKFTSVAAQTNYFISCAQHTFFDFLYQRKEQIIRVPINIEDLYDCNYVMYKNSRFSTKFFYAYITKLEWLSDQSTAVHIKTDVYQTWQFQLTFHDSFIERQHPATDQYNTLIFCPLFEDASRYIFVICKFALLATKGIYTQLIIRSPRPLFRIQRSFQNR